MTQPLVHESAPDMADAAAVPAEPAGRAHPWRAAAAIAAAGVPVGLLWWVLAPSGLNLVSGNPELGAGTNPLSWLPRDLVLAGLLLLAGCISGALVSGTKYQNPRARTIALVVLAGGLGAFAAWGTGVLCGQLWGTPADAGANPSVAFSLRSYAILAIWPAAVALSIFLDTVFVPAARAPKTSRRRVPGT